MEGERECECVVVSKCVKFFWVLLSFGCGLIGFRGRRARHEEMYVVQLVCPLVFLSFPIFFTVVSERFAIHLS